MNRKVEKNISLKGLGPKSIQCLNEVGIYSKSDLEKIGPVKAFIKIKKECVSMKPSLNLLYGLVSIVENIHWRDVAKNQKGRLMMEMEGYNELEIILNEKKT